MFQLQLNRYCSRLESEEVCQIDQSPLIAVVIVNYNGYELTRECLRSFAEVTYDNYILIVVDNASADNSVQRLMEEFSFVYYIENNYNMGFTGGNNIGLRKAEELGANYVLFLNNDTTVSKNILDELITFMLHNPEVGLVGPINYNYNSRSIISSCGGYIDRNTGMRKLYHLGKTIDQLKDDVIYCNFIEGVALFLSVPLAIEIGGFNDAYFLTSEESELCIKIAEKGFKLAVITSCSVWHKVSQSLTARSSFRVYFLFRNRLLFVKRNAIGFGVDDFFELAWFYAKSFAWFVLKGRNLSAAKALFLGTMDFFKGMTGAGRYAIKLHARGESRSD